MWNWVGFRKIHQKKSDISEPSHVLWKQLTVCTAKQSEFQLNTAHRTNIMSPKQRQLLKKQNIFIHVVNREFQNVIIIRPWLIPCCHLGRPIHKINSIFGFALLTSFSTSPQTTPLHAASITTSLSWQGTLKHLRRVARKPMCAWMCVYSMCGETSFDSKCPQSESQRAEEHWSHFVQRLGEKDSLREGQDWNVTGPCFNTWVFTQRAGLELLGTTAHPWTQGIQR